MAVPKFNEFFIPVLKICGDKNIHKRAEICESCSKILNLTEEDMNEKTKKGTEYRYKDRTTWALSHLKHAGLLISEKNGFYQISEEGINVLNKNLQHIDEKFLFENYESYRQFKNKNKNKKSKKSEKKEETSEVEEVNLTPTERLEDAYNEINEELTDELYNMIMNNSPRFFEELVVKLLIKMGYGFNENSGQTTSLTKDGGIDGIIFEDELGLSQIHIQAKKHSQPIGQSYMKEFAYTLEHGIPKGVMITTSSFTSGAIKISKESAAQIVLIDGEKLTQLMIKHDVGVFTEYNYSIKKIDKDFFDED